MKTIKRAALLAFALVAVLSISACGRNKQGGVFPKAVNIGYFSYVDETILIKQAGNFDAYLRENGGKVNWLQFEAGRDMNNAILAGSLDFAAGIGDPPIAIAVEADIPYKVVYIECETGTAEGLVVREQAGISTFDDLRGKTIATIVTSTCHYALLNALDAHGLRDRDVRILDLSAPDIVAAWERGDIDAAYTWDPSRSQLVNKGGKVLISSAEVAALGSPVSNYVVVRTKFAEEYPEIVTEFLRNYIRADNLYKNSPNEAAALWSSFLSITPGEALGQAAGSHWLSADEILSPERLGTVSAPGRSAVALKKVGDFLVEQKSLTTSQDISKYRGYLDPAFLEAAVKE